MLTRGFCPTLDGGRRPYDRTLPGMSVLQTVSAKVPEETKENTAVEPLAGAQQHQQLPPRPLEVGGVGLAVQALIQEVLAGEIRDKPLGGTAKSQRVEEVGRVAGKRDLATRGAPPTVTPGATALTKRTGPIPGLTCPNHSRAGVPVVDMEVKAGVVVVMVPEEQPTTTGRSPKKVRVL